MNKPESYTTKKDQLKWMLHKFQIYKDLNKLWRFISYLQEWSTLKGGLIP